MSVESEGLESKRHLFIPATTFIVAFCSIIYELVFAQTLTTVFGGTVLRYSATIGLFLLSLGVGAFLYEYIKDKVHTQRFFFITELLLAFFGLVGVFFIVYLSGPLGEALPYWVLLTLSHLPIVLVGILSGLELPLLTEFEAGKRFARVLGIDYVGSLVGSFVFALLLYPNFGLLTTSIIIALLNAFVAILFAVEYKLFSRNRLILLVVALTMLTVAIYYTYQKAEAVIQKLYFTGMVERGYESFNVPIASIEILDSITTPYQDVVMYNINFNQSEYLPSDTDTCLNLDEHVQMCNLWVHAYHSGLVDVPISFFPKDKKLSVLILGGGDFIATNSLRSYDDRILHIDLVDLDAKFQQYARTEPYLLEKNNRAFEYEKQSIFVQDAFYFLKRNKKTYDIILVDLPGLKHDKMLPLYSTEFYSFARSALSEGGILVSWRYPKDKFTAHGDVLERTLAASGFNNILEYHAWNTLPDGSQQKTETFFVVNKGDARIINTDDNEYVKSFEEEFKTSLWRPLSYKDGVRENSVFKPNYDMLITSPEKSMDRL